MAAFPFRLSVRALAGCVCLATGCSEYKPATDTPGADWSCLSAPRTNPDPIGVVGRDVTYSVQLVDLSTVQVISNVKLRACGLTDLECNNPVTGETPPDDAPPSPDRGGWLTPDASGWVDIPLKSNFQGYLEIESIPREAYVPYIFHLPEGELQTMREFPIVMISATAFGMLVAALQVDYDPDLGAIGARTFDCQGQLAPGVVLRNNTGGVPWYFQNGLPNTRRQETDDQGLAGFLRSQPGLTVSDAILPDGRAITSQSLIVRKQTMSTVYFRPPQVRQMQTLQAP